MIPNEEIASKVVSSMTNEKVISVTRMTTGDQYFVYALKTIDREFVIRMAHEQQKAKFYSAMYWQEKLLPLSIPLAKFIQSDLEGQYSPFPALLMNRLPGDDLCNLYSNLTGSDKKNLAMEMVSIQAKTYALPEGTSFGIADGYEKNTDDKTWFDFIMNRLLLFKNIIKEAKIFDPENVEQVINIAIDIKNEFDIISPHPFLWDASERNVLVHQGKISGIVDVDDICFGDPLFVIGLTSTALETAGYDTLYSDYWAEELYLNSSAKLRLAFYRLFFAIVFMRKQSMLTTNNQTIAFNIQRLNKIFHEALIRNRSYL